MLNPMTKFIMSKIFAQVFLNALAEVIFAKVNL